MGGLGLKPGGGLDAVRVRPGGGATGVDERR